MGGYIRIDKDQPTHPSVYDAVDRIIEMLNADNPHLDTCVIGEELPIAVAREIVRNALLGGLVTLWCYADRHIGDGNGDADVMPLSVTGASQVCGLPVTWLQELPEEWFKVRDDGSVELPNYSRKNHLIPKEKRVGSSTPGALRTRRYRLKKKEQRHTKNVTRHDRHSVTSPTGTGTDTVYLTGTGTPESAATLAAGVAAATPRRTFEEEFESRFGSKPGALAKQVPP